MITINKLKVEQFTFPGGEVQIRLPKDLKASPMDIVARLQSSDDIMAYRLTIDSIIRHYGKDYITNGIIPYLPYARQDRVCAHGEALGISVIKNILHCHHREICCFDIHNRSSISHYTLTSVSLLDTLKLIEPQFTDNSVLVAPDQGATEKVKEVAEYYNIDWIQGTKRRDPETGELTGFGVESGSCSLKEVIGKELLILDDICDGGGTFNGLAAVLKGALHPDTLKLFVTHGIFSKGLDTLEKNFDDIYTTDTFINDLLMPSKQFTVYKVVDKYLESV